VADAPFLAAPVAEQTRGGEKEQTPTPSPEARVPAIDLLEDRPDHRIVAVVVGEPVEGGALVVTPGPSPVGLHLEQVGELPDQVVAGHDAAGEEMAADPVGLVVQVEAVGGRPVGEDVDEHPPVGLQPAPRAGQQAAPVGHVFEHLHGDDAVERPFDVEGIHVGGDHRQVGQALRLGAGADEPALARRIGHRGDLGVGQGARHPERQRPPAASELQDLLAVAELRVAGGGQQGAFLGVLQPLDPFVVKGAGVLQLRAEAGEEEVRRQFVVLRVGRVGVLGDGMVGHLLGEARLGVVGRACQLPSRIGHQKFDCGPAHEVGQGRAFEGLDRRGDEAHAAGPFRLRGGRGKKALVRAW
jgi:hypothetical protein